MICRHCSSELKLTLVDLASAPPSNAYLTVQTVEAPERSYPLRVLVCENCWLAQTEDFAKANELFGSDYAYFSSCSSSWLAHASRYVDEMVARFGLGGASHVVEIAANDGYLLQYVLRRNIPCTGIEPTAGTAAAARAKGIPIIEDFFGARLAAELVSKGLTADLVAANNVLAHVPDINDFAAGIERLLKPQGVATFEFPHLLRLIAENQFDTIYHEHFSYLSLTAVVRILGVAGLGVFDVEEHPTHGGSLRVFAQRTKTGQHRRTARVDELVSHEAGAGMLSAAYYGGFQARTEKVRDDFLSFLKDAKRRGKTVVGYGAAAKGNTLLNYAGVQPDLLTFVADRNPAKQGKFMPGSRIPIVPEARLRETRPDYVVIFPWNLQAEVTQQLDYIQDWAGRFITAVPELRLHEVGPRK